MLLSLFAAAVLVQSSAQSPQRADTIGTLVVAHGADNTWNSLVDSVVSQVRLPGPVGVSFLMGGGARDRRFQDVARALVRKGARRIVVVPLFVSSHSGHYDQLRYLVGQTDSLDEEMLHHLHEAGIGRAPELTFQLLSAIDAAPEIARVLTARASKLVTAPGEQGVLLLAHGPNSAEDYAAWMTNLRSLADSVQQAGNFRHVLVELLRDDASEMVRAEANRRIRELVTLEHEATNRPVIVVPVLISRGGLTRRTVPQILEGLPVAYSGEPLSPDPGVSRWIERSVQESAIHPAEALGFRVRSF
jgi:sirohydrochlorin cobaltochelatase